MSSNSTPQFIPDSVTSAIVPAGTLLLFVGRDNQGNIPIYAKNPDSSYSTIGGGNGQKTINGLMLDGATVRISKGITFNEPRFINNTVSVYNGGVLNKAIQSSGGIDINAGGTANYVSVFNAGLIYIRGDGNINNVQINSNCSMFVSSGGEATSVVIQDKGTLLTSSGSLINTLSVSSGASLYPRGGTLSSVTISVGGQIGRFSWSYPLYWSSFSGGSSLAVGDAVILGSDCNSMSVASGSASGITVGNGGSAFVTNTGITENFIVSNGGKIYVYSGGSANNTFGDSSTELHVSSGGTMNSTVVSGSYCTLWIHSSGRANNTVVKGGDSRFLRIEGFGTASSTTLYDKASMYVYQNGSTNDTTVNPGCSMFIGGTATNIKQAGGNIVSSNGAVVTFASNTFSNLVLATGAATIHSGTTAINPTINGSGNTSGFLYVYSGGLVSNATLGSSGRLFISVGGITNSVTINSGGSLIVSSGGTALQVTSSAGAYVSSAAGAVIQYVTP